MEPALKQRLLGAAVLVALAVIFLPMFFSGSPPKPGEQNIDLDIPTEPDATMQSRVYELPLPDAPDTAATATATPAAAPGAATVDVVSVPDAVVHGEAESTAAPSVEEAPDTAAPAAGDKPAAPRRQPAASPQTAADVGYLVSLGVFADRGNAESQLAAARKLGYQARLESVPVNGKPANGVRVGPFSGRASAEAARLKLKNAIAGSEPALVAVDSAHAGATTAHMQAAANGPGGWAVQLAALRERKDAVAMEKRVRAAGFEAFVDDTRGSDGTWWRVRVGPRAERADAEKLAAEIKARLHMQAIVVSHP